MAKGDVLVRMKADVSGYDANIAKARRQLENFKKDNLSLGGVMKQTQGALLATAARFASVTAAVGALGAAFMDNIATARKFEVSMSQLSSLTGMVGADLAKLKDYAIELGSSTTLSASQVADAFKMIGSQQPQLLASGEALKSVTKNAITLAEAAGIDLATAAQTLSTSINQMGGDSGNAERYINVLAAASQKGAGDIAWLGEAITKSGTTAKAVGTDYEELVANLEQLAKAGFDASTAGTALRSIIMNLEKQANNDFKPSVVGLTQAFENLGKANLSIVGYQEIAGKMFASQAKALADAAGEARDMTSAITGTNTAEEQAKTNTDNLEGSIKALSSAWEGFNLHLNSSNGIFRDIVDGLKDVVVWADNVITKLGEIPNPENIITKNLKEVGPNVDDNGNYIKRPAQKGAVGFDWENGTWMKGYTGAIYNGATGQTELPEVEVVGNKITKGGGGKNNKTKKTKTEPVYVEGSLAAQAKLVSDLTKKWNEAGEDMRTGYLYQLIEAEKKLKSIKDEQQALRDIRTNGEVKGISPVGLSDQLFKGKTLKELQGVKLELKLPKEKTEASFTKEVGAMAGGISQMVGGIEALGIELPEGMKNAVEGITSLISIVSGIATVVTAIEALTAADTIIPFARGGVVHAANGFVPGNNFSGDMIPAALNAGELVLNRAQQGNLASQLQGGGFGGWKLTTKLAGTDLLVSLERTLQKQGYGKLATWG